MCSGNPSWIVVAIVIEDESVGMNIIPVDPNMGTALQWANELGPPPKLPLSLQDVTQRAKLVCSINTKNLADALLADFYGKLSDKEKDQCLNEVARSSKTYISDIDEDGVRVNISLRLWSGCLSAAKTIALQTMAGPNTPDDRASILRHIDSIAQRDSIYHAGVEAAPSLQKTFKGGLFF